MIHSYPKVFNLGHPGIDRLLDGPVVVQEKVDGSQWSVMRCDDALLFRSHHQQLVEGSQQKLFDLAVQQCADRRLHFRQHWVYRFEYLAKPKHNTLAYGRVPTGNLMLFDIETAPSFFLGPDQVRKEADVLGVEYVAQIAQLDGSSINLDLLNEWLNTKSALGKQLVEGVVIKNYSQFGRDGKVMMGKHVSEAFKEIHKKDFKDRNPGGKDLVGILGQELRTESRWHKAVQHLAEKGELLGEPKDIGNLMKRAAIDLKEECEEYIKDKLFKWAWPQIQRAATRGLPEWYKTELAKKQFDE